MKAPGEVSARYSRAWITFREMHTAMVDADYSPENLRRIVALIEAHLEELEK